MFITGRQHRFPGFFVGLLAVLYAPVRFALDFMRKVDVRYGGLTPGQWGSIILLGVGLYIWMRQSRKPGAAAVAAKPARA
jgi:phosphatidylglycerol:prolipoprotein diacylglycerol transferase